MTRAIETVEGVRSVDVSFELSEAAVVSDRCSSEAYGQIGEALEREGYGGTVTVAKPLDTQPLEAQPTQN